MTAKAAAKPPIFLIICIVVGIIIAFRSCSFGSFGSRPLEWSVELNRDDAFTIATVVLAHGRVTGCGDLEVTKQYGTLKEIDVRCGDGRTHSLQWSPVFKVDGSIPKVDTWDHTNLAELNCVRDENGKWLPAWIDIGNAAKAAEEQSKRTGKVVRLYRASSTIYGVTQKNGDGTWRTIYAMDRLTGRDKDERRGCELAEDES